MLEKVQAGLSTPMWDDLGLVSNIQNSKKVKPGGAGQSEFSTCSQAYGRKICKALLGYDIRAPYELLSPCAASAFPEGALRDAQAARCTLSKFMFLTYMHPLSHELFGKSKPEMDVLLAKVVDKWVELTATVLPPKWCSRADGSGFWFGWNKRSCQFYATDLPLWYFAVGSQPWESQCEEGQGFGRKCMRHCIGLTAQDPPMHMRCAVLGYNIGGTSILMTDEQIRADAEQHKRDYFAWTKQWHLDTLAALDGALAFSLPADWVSPLWQDMSAEDAGAVADALDDASEVGDMQRGAETLEERETRGAESDDYVPDTDDAAVAAAAALETQQQAAADAAQGEEGADDDADDDAAADS
jgi:hypothetical protein